MLIKMSLRGAKRRSNLNGFSLIELMVAVVILAMAIFGIFHAYSVGFMGMADARDRTVATNYAREAMEDIKNMDFEKIITQSRNFITGTKYEREVIVQESTNLKKVTTKVYWKDRKNNTKIVETDMLVHFMQTTAGTATRIMLFADSYTVLPGGSTELTAVVKDKKGNTVTMWTGDITFSIDSGSGSITPGVVTPEKGIANATFTASETEGEVIITASASGLTSDSVTIKVTDPKIPVKINLIASPIFMTANTSSTSEITATIVDAGGATVTEATNEVTFSVSGPGTLSSPITITPTNGIAEITLTSNGTPGTITVTASASGLEPGVVDVITGGQISLFASNTTVPVNEKSEITVTTKDINGIPINYIGTISLSLVIPEGSTGSGILSSYTLTFDGSTSSMTVTFTASSEGTVNITAEDQAGILTSADPLSLTITEALVPDHIAVYAEPSSIKAGGIETSTITARVKTADNITITSYTEPITFDTNGGTFNSYGGPTNISLNVDESGVAIVELFPPTNSGTAIITVSSGSLDDVTVDVGFYIDADHIQLIADPQSIAAINGNTTTITATIVDEFGAPVNCNGSIIFSIVLGSDCGELIGSNPIVLDNESQATIELSSNGTAGDVEVKAEANITSPSIKQLNSNITIEIKDITLELVEYSLSYSPPSEFEIVTFNIEINGAVLNLNGMKVVWNLTPSKLNKIEIKSPSTAENYDPIIDTGNASSPYTENNIDKNLLLGESSIRLTFSTNMEGIPLVVTFYTNYGDYELTIVE